MQTSLIFLSCLLLVANGFVRELKTISDLLKFDEDAEADNTGLPGGYDVETNNLLANPCDQLRCHSGQECDIDELGNPVCVCIHECAEPPRDEAGNVPPGDQVCSTQNETFNSECELDRVRCRCRSKYPDCPYSRLQHAHLDYYGPCRFMPKCSDEQLDAMQERLQDWFQVMLEEALDKGKAEDPVSQLTAERYRLAEESRAWQIGAIWKFCLLDENNDMSVSRRELLPIRATVLPLEHCVGDFFDSCDRDKDHHITFEEWGSCLDVGSAAEVESLADLCLNA